MNSFPLRHLSVRVPWHDAGWKGTVCENPKLNTACLKLKGISELKDEEVEERIKGQSIGELINKDAKLPPCVVERATFMADFEFVRYREHPYKKGNPETHGHFQETALRYPARSAAAIPFRWMMCDVAFGNQKKDTPGLFEMFPLEELDPEFEPELPFKTTWIQDHRNHRALLECFWNHVQTEESLVFFYAKQVPLVEDTGRRVLIGVGRVKKLTDLTEYSYDGPPEDKLRSMLWERMVIHSIRPAFEDGFLMPYQEALEKSDEGRKFDPAEVVAFAPEERFVEFSFATEHVGSDSAISALLSMRSALNRCSELFDCHIDSYERWIDKELGRLWKRRGPFPGIGAVLSATGVALGNFISQAIMDKVGDNGNPWSAWFEALKEPAAMLPAELARHIDDTISKAWTRMNRVRRSFLELLSRMDLSQEQARILVSPEEREEYGFLHSDDDILANPYLIYEATRLSVEPVSIGVVDRGIFPNARIRKAFPIPDPSLIKTAVDARRLRALTVRNLEIAAQNGDTLRQRDNVIRDLRRGSIDDEEMKSSITADLLTVAEDEIFAGEIRLVNMADEKPAYQLDRLGRAGELIRSTVDKRIAGKRNTLSVDWRELLDTFLEKNNVTLSDNPEEREREESARTEKTAALRELAASRFSVLIGSAGTGKTTLLSVLCSQPEINMNGVLLLAPTGKARVRMEDMARRGGIDNCHAYTLAQHLSATDRYDGSIQRYLMTGERGEKIAKTVIVDECSMLTEEMMAALIESLTGMDRLIFVGDHRQLPPIGAGRPFVDIVTRLRPAEFDEGESHVGPAFAELHVPMRQGAGERDDLLLASWFGGGTTSAGDDQIFEILSSQRDSRTVQFVAWETPEELEKILPTVLATTLEFDPDIEEWQAFAVSLGGTEWNGSVWYNTRYRDKAGSGIAAEDWQILRRCPEINHRFL